MTKLWILLAVSLVLAWLIDNRDKKLQYCGIERRERLFTAMLAVILIFFSGLRTWGNDTVTYLQMYDQIPQLEEYLNGGGYSFAGGWGFGAVMSLLKTLGFSSQNYLLFFAFATVIPYLMFVRRYSESMVFGVFLLLTTGVYTFSMAAIKQCMATALCLLAVNAALDKKWVRFLLLVGSAMLFHPYSVVYLLVPLLMFRPWTFRTVVYVVAFVTIGFLLESLLGVVLDVTSMIGATYDEESFVGEGVNIFRVAVCFVPMMLALLCGRPLFRNSGREENLMFNMAMINALIMFVGLFGTANYFARLANYFLPAQIIVLPWILNRLVRRDRVLLKVACVVGYLGYFIYENNIVRSFDAHFSHITVWQYFSSLF